MIPWARCVAVTYLERQIPPVAIWGTPSLAREERQALEHDYRYAKTRLVRQRSHILLLCTQLDSQSAADFDASTAALLRRAFGDETE